MTAHVPERQFRDAGRLFVLNEKFTMSLFRWFTRNWADTDEDTHADVKPVELPMPPAEALAQIEATIRRLPRWHVESVDAEAVTIHATRRTRTVRFVDDVTIRVESVESGSRVHARSQSRVGKGDLGQNRRNLLELFDAIR